MKTKIPAQKGMALVVVLGLLALLTVLVVAFFSSVGVDTQGSAANRNLATLRQLGDLPLQIAQTQIRAATTLGQNGTLSESVNTWTSQPGLLRVYDNTGRFVRAFKLYSSPELETDSLDFIGNDIARDWPAHPNRWVNLNEPFLASASGNRTLWPILNPNAVHWAEGLEIQADPAGDTRATMPVEWLYVLEDGSVVAQSAITAENPPVGRIAFWTDDETCKININTAGERTMWDRPRAWHEKREIYGKNQPSTGEYNAYPGHPATVSLSAVFGKALKDAGGTPDSDGQVVEAMLGLTPRYRWGGSENASRSIWDRNEDWKKGSITNINKNERLYATPSEFLLNVSRDVNDPRLKTPIQESGFLLTESSRAPELNAFGLPRVGIWPIDENPAKRTVYDNLIARCLTIGNKPYYFQRADPSKRDEAEAISRNWEILNYLDAVTRREINGFGGNFENKWGLDEKRQILTEIFDYVRAATNLSDTSRDEDQYNLQFSPATALTRGFVCPTEVSNWNTRGLGRAPVLTHAAILFYAYEQHWTNNGTDEQSLAEPLLTDVNAVLLFNFFEPFQGMAPYTARYRMTMRKAPMAIKAPSDTTYQSLQLSGSTMNALRFPKNDQKQGTDWGGYTGALMHQGTIVGSGYDPSYYTLQTTQPVRIVGTQMDFQGGLFEIEVRDDYSGELLQTYEIEFPSSTTSWPVPLLWAGYFHPNPQPGKLAFLPDHYSGHNPKYFHKRTRGEHEKPQDGPLDPGSQWDTIEEKVKQYNHIIGRRNPAHSNVDVIRTVELCDGDGRLIAGLNNVDKSFFMPGYGYFSGSRHLTGSLKWNGPTSLLNNDITDIEKDVRPGGLNSQFGRHVNLILKGTEYPALPRLLSNGDPLLSLRGANWAGDFDNGFLRLSDGPYANKPDEGHVFPLNAGDLPYDSAPALSISDDTRSSWDPRVNGFFSPTRQVPSAIMFGSLPTGVKRTENAYRTGNATASRPWETLRFCPNTAADMEPDGAGHAGHPGALAPQDHHLLDLFTMPVAEPYAISEPFSTAGKINLNQRIVPFTHLKRETGLRGVLKNLEMTAINSTVGFASYRSGNVVTQSIRKVDVDATLSEMGTVLDPGNQTGKGAFRSASEICGIFLIPQDRNIKDVVDWKPGDPAYFWQGHKLTGDNTREAPYNYIYPLLTTKSNTYQIHYRVQTLKPLRQRADYDPTKDFTITGEQRGSYVIERYLDVNDPRLQGINTDARSLNDFYQFRTLRHDRFAPSL